MEYAQNEKAANISFTEHESGCHKMSLCGSVEQTKNIHFHVYDNMEKENVAVEVLMHIGQETVNMSVTTVPNEAYSYHFDFSHNRKGIAIMEVYVGGLQIPESPFRVEVIDRDCDADFPGKRMIAVSDVLDAFQF